MHRISVMLAVAIIGGASSLAAQSKPPVRVDTTRMDHSKMDHSTHHAMQEKAMHGDSHASSGWKELDSYHQLMMQTWHPIKDKGDVSAIRSKAPQLLAAAKVLAGAKAPKGCDTPELKAAASGLLTQTDAVATLVSKKADDASVSAAMKTLHDRFEVLEEGCKSH